MGASKLARYDFLRWGRLAEATVAIIGGIMGDTL